MLIRALDAVLLLLGDNGYSNEVLPPSQGIVPKIPNWYIERDATVVAVLDMTLVHVFSRIDAVSAIRFRADGPRQHTEVSAANGGVIITFVCTDNRRATFCETATTCDQIHSEMPIRVFTRTLIYNR